jgi:hypothetical protein
MAIITSGKNQVPSMPPGTTYSREELDKLEREMKERVSKPSKGSSDFDAGAVASYFRRSFWWSSWLPWLFFPFFARVNSRTIEVLIPLVPIAIASLLGYVLPVEGILAVISFFLGICFHLRYKNQRVSH